MTLNIQLISCLSAHSSPKETPMMEKYILTLDKKKTKKLSFDQAELFFFLDTADAFFFAQVKFHKSSTMLSQEQEKNVSAEAYCKSSWKGPLN